MVQICGTDWPLSERKCN